MCFADLRAKAGLERVNGPFRADDGIRTRDSHLGNCKADFSHVSASPRSAVELHVLGALVSPVSPDHSRRFHFVGDLVGAESDLSTLDPESYVKTARLRLQAQ